MRLRYVAVVMAVLGYYLADGGDGTVRAGAALVPPSCESYCMESRPCDGLCYVWVGEDMMYSTCGEYDGGWENGMCDGNSCWACGPTASCDQSCFLAGEPTDCGTYGKCATCGDDICAFGVETRTSCPQDCGYCGDGICQYQYEVNTYYRCEDDCGTLAPLENEEPNCDPVDGDPGCAEGACTARGMCEPLAYPGSGGLCYTNTDCSSGYQCYVFFDLPSGQGYCVHNPFAMSR